jgi:hypothetical protein
MRDQTFAALLVLAVGCAPLIDPPEGVFVCSSDDDCPADFRCAADSTCRRVGGVDAGPGIDGAVDAGDAEIDGGPPGLVAPRLLRPWMGEMTGSAVTGSAPAERNALRPLFVWEEVTDASRYELGLTDACPTTGFAGCDIADVETIPAPASSWRPPTALTVDTAAPVGRRYFFRLRACFGDDTCTPWTSIRYADVGRLRNDFDGDGRSNFAFSGRGGPYPAPGVVEYLAADGTMTFLANPRSADGDNFGYPIAAVGDVNADGYPDLAIGATGDTTGGEDQAGSVHVFLGGSDGLRTTRVVSLASPTPRDMGRFGGGVAGVDLDADGYSDIIAADSAADVGGVMRAGAAQIFRGSASGPQTSASGQLTMPVPVSGSGFANSIEALGDIDGDGHADVGVGFSNYGTATAANVGALFVYGGADVATVDPAIVTMATPMIGAGIGYVIAGLGDLNGDGYADVAMQGNDEFDGMRPGSVFVFSGSAAGLVPGAEPVLRSPNQADNYGFGNTLAIDGDVNGDGVDDLLVGEFQGMPGAVRTGAAYVFFGRVSDPRMAPDQTLLPMRVTLDDIAWYGRAVAYGALDADGFDDVVVTASQQDVAPVTNLGQAFVFSGSAAGAVYSTSYLPSMAVSQYEWGEQVAWLLIPSAIRRLTSRLPG